MNIYNLYNTEAQFKNYLIAGKVSTVSIRNYLSDFRFFCGWLQRVLATSDLDNFLKNKSGVFQEYQAYLEASVTSLKTQKRRLSTLRKYYDFLLEEKIIEYLPARFDAKPPSVINAQLNTDEFSYMLSSFKYELLQSETSAEAEKVAKNVNELLSFFQSK